MSSGASSPGEEAKSAIEEAQERSTLLAPEVDHHRRSDERFKLRFLYVGHFLGRWGGGMWQFLIALLLIQVGSKTLLLTAVYGLVEAAAVAALGAFVGTAVDRIEPLKLLQLSLGIRNLSVTLSALILLLLLARQPWGNVFTWSLAIVLLNTLGGVGVLSGLACTILLERDWAVRIAGVREGEDHSLTSINAVMRRIDLVCKLLAPAFVGFLMTRISSTACLVATVVWNIFSLALEYRLLCSANAKIPARVKKSEQMELESGEFRKLFQGWGSYFKQEAALAAVALAILYCSVLSFGSIMTSALEWRGVSALAIGLTRGLAALVGVGATYLFPILHSRGGTQKSGLWAVWIQWICLILSVASIWIRSSRVSSAVLISGVVASRLGLWMFDLAVTQLMQMTVGESERGKIGGVQNSLQSLMTMLSFAMTIYSPDPQEFGKLVIFSFLLVTLAALLFSSHCYLRQCP